MLLETARAQNSPRYGQCRCEAFKQALEASLRQSAEELDTLRHALMRSEAEADALKAALDAETLLRTDRSASAGKPPAASEGRELQEEVQRLKGEIAQLLEAKRRDEEVLCASPMVCGVCGCVNVHTWQPLESCTPGPQDSLRLIDRTVAYSSEWPTNAA